MSPVVIAGALVVTLDDAGTIGRFDVSIRDDGRIGDVAPAGSLAGTDSGAERVDARDRILLPGLINAHVHPDMHLLKGLLEGFRLHEWEHAVGFQCGLAALTPQEAWPLQRAAVRAALADALLSGTTTIGTYGVRPGIARIAAEEMAALGLRGTVTIRDREFRPVEPLARPHVYRLHAEEELDDAELSAAAAAHRRGERFVMHCSETEWRRALMIERFGAPTIRVLDRYGLLSPRTLLSHAIQVDDEERTLIAERGSPVVVSPATEMKLGDGIAPVVDYLRAGITVAVGTDCPPCNNGNDLLLELRMLGLTQSLRYGPAALGPERILRSGTAAGAAALGLPANAGRIAPGAPADLALIDAATARLRPLLHDEHFSNVAAGLVFSATGQDVTDVMIDGHWRVRDRRIPGVDQDALWDELQEAGVELHQRLRAAATATGPKG
ncbi:MAG: amidohydrolase family protein [Longimicrobiales bacterium]